MSILKLKPACKDYLWGGHRLVDEYNVEYDGDILADAGRCSEETVLIVTHAGPIAAIMGACFAHLSRNRYEWQPACGRGYRIRYRDEMPVSFEPV